MYVTNSLFYIQHLLGNNENDDDRCMYAIKFQDLIDRSRKPVEEEVDAEEIIDRMINKMNN